MLSSARLGAYLQAHGLHAGHGCQQEAVVQIAEKLDGVVDARGLWVALEQQP